jgi:nicotinate-nucleotide--dimethylbenzimidazole phosphoribosyltransferase
MNFLDLARATLDSKAKPPGSLGLLEQWTIKLIDLQRTTSPTIPYDTASLLIFSADHGVTTSFQAVSAYPRAVSAAVFKTIAHGGGASSVLCSANDCRLFLVDVGLDADLSHISSNNNNPTSTIEVMHCKVAMGSNDFTAGPAMSIEMLDQALDVGKKAVLNHYNRHSISGDTLRNINSRGPVCIGELGIGNTTCASTILAALLNLPPEVVCGRGTGVDDNGLEIKQSAVRRGLEVNNELIQQRNRCAKGVLQAVGGLEIAAMVGAYLKAAELRLPVVVDGFVSGVAALLALRWRNKKEGEEEEEDDQVEKCLFWSHCSAEKAAGEVLKAANNAQAALSMSLRLGEGTGAVLALPLLRSAAALAKMATLEDALKY